jgi:elongation factor G
MKREYACEVISGKPQVAYREAMSMRADFNYTHKKQTGGSGQYGKVAGFIEPLPAEHPTGFEFVDDITGGSIPREFIPACEKGFKEAVKKGPLIGFPIVGVRCTINDGASHPVDSSEIAFRTAALMGFREAYMNAKPTILEPIMRVEVQFPEEFQGAVMGQLNQRRGTIISSEKQEGFVQAMAEVPLNDMFGYSTDLRSATQGKGEFTMEFQKYAEVPKQQREVMITEFRNKKDK